MDTVIQSIPDYSEPQAARLAGPWVRYAARLTDMMLFAVVLDFIPSWNEWTFRILRSDENTVRVLGGMITGLAWLPVEAWFLAFISMTPGKWLYRLEVRGADNPRLGILIAFKRSFLVFVSGLGFGIRPISLVLMFICWRRLCKGQTMYWDDMCFSEVHQAQRGNVRPRCGIAARRPATRVRIS